MLNLEMVVRDDFTREGLIEALVFVFSDDYTSDANGVGYITKEAKEAGYETTDDYHRAKWTAFEGEELDLVAQAFEDYASTLDEYCDESSYTLCLNGDGQVVSIAFASHLD